MFNKKLQYTYCQIPHKVKANSNKIWLNNRMQQEKYFSLKLHAENEARRLSPDLFLFFNNT